MRKMTCKQENLSNVSRTARSKLNIEEMKIEMKITHENSI